MVPTKWSSQTIATLRNCQLMHSGEYEGKRFVRCVPVRLGSGNAPLTDDERRRITSEVVADVAETGVCLSHNPDVGGYYVRVEITTAAYRAICYMKS